MEHAKRRVPRVEPISHNGVRYEVVRGARARGFPQNGGVLAAVDEASGRELWTLTVYKTEYDPKEEPDVQDVFIVRQTLSDDGTQITVEDERKRRFVVTLADQSVREAK